RLGTAASIASRTDDRITILVRSLVGMFGSSCRHQPVGPLVLPARGVALVVARFMFGLGQLVQEVPEPVRHALAIAIVLPPLQDVPDPALVLAAEASSGLSSLGVRLHGRL